MDKKLALQVLLVSLVLMTMVTAVSAAREEEENCVVKPASGISVSTVTQGISFIMAGGTGPLIILAIAFVLGLVVSHLLWGGF
jgi:hypothetical protein